MVEEEYWLAVSLGMYFIQYWISLSESIAEVLQKQLVATKAGSTSHFFCWTVAVPQWRLCLTSRAAMRHPCYRCARAIHMRMMTRRYWRETWRQCHNHRRILTSQRVRTLCWGTYCPCCNMNVESFIDRDSSKDLDNVQIVTFGVFAMVYKYRYISHLAGPVLLVGLWMHPLEGHSSWEGPCLYQLPC